MNIVEDKWSMDESEILPVLDQNISSFVEHRVLKATGTSDSEHDRKEDSYTSISSSTSCTDAMVDSQLELANARLMQANALADIARLKVAKAANKAASASSGRSRSRLEGNKARGGDSFERDLSMIIGEDYPAGVPGATRKVPALLIPPPEGTSSSYQNQVQSPFVPSLELNAEILKIFTEA